MKDVKVSKDCYIPKENIKLYLSYSTNTVKEDVREKRKKNQVFDYTFGKKILSVIYLISGEVVLVNTAIDTLHYRMIQNDKPEPVK